MKIKFSEKLTIGSRILVILAFVVLLPLLLVGILIYILWGIALCIAIWLTWRERSVLFVYSESPIWKEYIEREIIPQIQNQAVILNWSERRNWKNSLAVLTFKYFGGYRNFNPIAIVFRPFRLVRTYRFFEAFKEFKHGNLQKVEIIKNELFENLGIEKIPTPDN